MNRTHLLHAFRGLIPVLILVGVLLASSLPALLPGAAAAATTLRFSGYDWTVRSWTGSPGPCKFSASNVWVDSKGYLHLKVRKVDGVWSCAELYTTKALTFGTYQWRIQGNLNALDKNIVFGMFPHQQYRDYRYTNEIDIEWAKWGRADFPYKLKFHVWPPYETGTEKHYAQFNEPRSSGGTTMTLVWSKKSVSFQAKYTSTGTVYASWTYAPTDYYNHIPTAPMVTMMNLWLFGNRAPSDGEEVEIVFTGFTYTTTTATSGGTTSPPQTVSIQGSVPVPTLLLPANGAVTTDHTPFLDWSSVTAVSSVHYRLQVDNNADFSSPVVNLPWLTNSSYGNPTALANGTYYWRVGAVDAAGNASAWTASRSFRVA